MGEKMCTEYFTVEQLQLSTVIMFFQPKELKKDKTKPKQLYKCWKDFFLLLFFYSYFNCIGSKLVGIIGSNTLSWDSQTKIY